MNRLASLLRKLLALLTRRSNTDPPKPGKEENVTPATPKHRPWTLMIYMAGDNGLILDSKLGKIKLMAEMTSAGYKDLMEMGAIGTTDNVAVACLFDTQTDTYLIEVRKGNGFADSAVRRIPEVDTGDPNTLRTFIVQAAKAYPADHYALVIWNHGAGWLDTDAYAVIRSADPDVKSHGPIFRTTPVRITRGDKTRPIAFDDSSKDFLDSADLRQAFSEAEAAAGIRLDLIGMDACLMAMVEGACELAPYADYFVASQEVEPMAGWPYTPILKVMDSQPGLLPSALATTVVSEYAGSYGGKTRGQTVTQSAIALTQTATTEALCKALVEGILAIRTPSLRFQIMKARGRTLAFQDRNYCDLGDLAAKIAAQTEFDYEEVAAAARALSDHLAKRGSDAPVLEVGFLPDYEAATGMSVYFPPTKQDEQLEIYRKLSFPQRTGWDRLIEWVFEEFA